MANLDFELDINSVLKENEAFLQAKGIEVAPTQEGLSAEEEAALLDRERVAEEESHPVPGRHPDIQQKIESRASDAIVAIRGLALERFYDVADERRDLTRIWEVGGDTKGVISRLAFLALDSITEELGVKAEPVHPLYAKQHTVYLGEVTTAHTDISLFYKYVYKHLNEREKEKVRQLRGRGYDLPHISDAGNHAHWHALVAMNREHRHNPRVGTALPSYGALALRLPYQEEGEEFDAGFVGSLIEAHKQSLPAVLVHSKAKKRRSSGSRH